MLWVIAFAFFVLVGLAFGLTAAERRALGPAVTLFLGSALSLACALSVQVLAVDPKRGLGAPLPPPWAGVLALLAAGLVLGIPSAAGAFVGFSICDFAFRERSRWVRLGAYVIVLSALVALGPWVFGVTFD